jgi:hypothetical protein
MDAAILYILAAPLPGTRAPAYLMHAVGGVDCVLAYTDLEHLVECCGEHQPWLGVRIDALMADLRDQRLPGPVVNLPLAPGARWTADGPPWEQSRPGEASEADEADAAAAAEPATERPAPAASEFGGWDEDERADAVVADPAGIVEVGTVEVGTAAADAGSVSITPQEWWR